MPVTAAEGQIEFNVKFDKVTTALRNIQGQLGNVQGGLENLSSKSTKVTNSFTKIGAIGRQVFGGLVGILGFAGIARAATGAIKQFATFEQTIRNAASVAGFTGDEFIKVSKAAREMSKESTKSAIEIGEGFYFVASAGFTATEQIAAMTGIVALSEATMTGMAFTTDVVTATIAQFGLEASDATRVADVFTRAIAGSQANMNKLGGAMRHAGAIASSMGWSLEETVVVLAQFFNAGLRGEQAGTGLKGAIAQLIKPNQDLIEVLRKAEKSIDDINPTMNSFADIIVTLKSAGIEAKDVMRLFGQEAGPAMATALGGSIEKLDALNAALSDTSKTAKSVAEEQMKTLSGQLKILNNLWTNFELTLVEGIIPALKDTLPLLSAFIEKLGIAYAFWRTTEEATTMKQIKNIRLELSFYTDIINLEDHRAARRQELLNNLRSQEALLRVIRGETKKNVETVMELHNAHVKAWEASQRKKIAPTTKLTIFDIDPDELKKALIEQESIYNAHWEKMNKLGMISTEQYVENLRNQRENLVIVFGEYSMQVMEWDLKILALEEKINDKRLENEKRLIEEKEILLSEAFNLADEWLQKDIISHQESLDIKGTALLMFYQSGVINFAEYLEQLDALKAEHDAREIESEEDKVKRMEQMTSSLSSLFRGFLQDGNKDIIKSTNVWKAATSDFQRVAVSAFNNISAAIGNLIVMGGSWKDAFKKIAANIIAEIARIIIKMLILKAIQMAIGGGGGGLPVGVFGLGGFAFQGPGSLPPIPKGASGFITQGTGQSDNILALLKPDEVVMPKSYTKEFFGTMGEKLFKGESLTLSGGGSRGAMSIGSISINVYGVTDADSFRDQYDSIAEKLVETVQKRIYLHQ